MKTFEKEFRSLAKLLEEDEELEEYLAWRRGHTSRRFKRRRRM